MGMVSEKGNVVGICGGVHQSKNGKAFISVMSEGPKMNKIMVPSMSMVQGSDAPFGAPVYVELVNCEQKFSDYNNVFIEAQSAKVIPNKVQKQ